MLEESLLESYERSARRWRWSYFIGAVIPVLAALSTVLTSDVSSADDPSGGVPLPGAPQSSGSTSVAVLLAIVTWLAIGAVLLVIAAKRHEARRPSRATDIAIEAADDTWLEVASERRSLATGDGVHS